MTAIILSPLIFMIGLILFVWALCTPGTQVLAAAVSGCLMDSAVIFWAVRDR